VCLRSSEPLSVAHSRSSDNMEYAEIQTPLITKWLRPGWKEVVSPFRFYSSRLACVVTVEEGFQYDGDSLLRAMPLSYAWLKGRAPISACGHDWLYRYGKVGDVAITRHTADLVMLDLMVAEGVAWRHRHAIYYGVRIGGRRSWNGHRATSTP
jgi:hypothetical protein